ncbi:MAG: HPr family phosphocarrier protein [Anaerolineaceae bacterium]|nr:HPr family phosphocarrier protein [Anaerolineaceae bacterium]
MEKKSITVTNKEGLHARPASLFVKEAGKFKCKITLSKHGGKEGNAKSILSLLALGIDSGSTIDILCEGEDEKAAAQALYDLIDGFNKECK